jgi:hypothetical protein
MTPTRYMTDARETTNEHIDEYLAQLEAAERAGTSRATVINRNFNELSFDIQLRFMQTVGAVKVLALCAKRSRLEERLDGLLQRALDDLDYIEGRCADGDLRRHKRRNDHNTVCRDIVNRCLASWAEWLDLAQVLTGAERIIADQIALDYEMLVEQFRDFRHDGTTAIYEASETAQMAA